MFRHKIRVVLLALLLALPAVPCAAAPRLYLTFDADMTPAMVRRLKTGAVAVWYDERIVEFLHEKQVPAVIYVSGLFAETYPDLIRRLSKDPLVTIGVHGYSHAAYTRHCYGLAVLSTDKEKRADIVRARDAIAAIAGRVPQLFRYPGLCRDDHDDQLVREAGLTVDTPTVIAGDSFNRHVEAIVRQVLRAAKDGDTVLFHLGGPNAPATLEALQQIVPALEQKGFEFAPR
jgi:peptidoglycan/xylan/chitin deacetylase (PgdA/CDA1 family)